MKIYQVDAFTNTLFGGNPAGVCILPEQREERWMQLVAREMNLAETAFLVRNREGFQLRWFTPAVEVDLCGHATLASAHILWETGQLEPCEEARFHTKSCLLTANRKEDIIELDFPMEAEQEAQAPRELLEGLGAVPRYVGQNRMDYLVELEDEAAVSNLEPNLALLAKVPVRGIIVTARSNRPEFDFVSRFFAPASGIPEDPVTGSAHCCLGPYWEKRLGKGSFTAWQASERGGAVRVRNEGNRVLLGGQAVTVFTAEMRE
jgi:PhzF family phenazine biosynthesis protein